MNARAFFLRVSGLLSFVSAWLVFAAPARCVVPGDLPAEGSVVARFALLAPGKSSFLLHGTVPLPRGARIEELSGRLALRSHDAGRTLVPVQIEIVSRAPTGVADVIEVLAPVELAREETRGKPVSFELVLGPRIELPARPANARVDALLRPAADAGEAGDAGDTDRPRFELRAHDPTLVLHTIDLYERADGRKKGAERDLSDGPWRRVRRIHDVLHPPETGAATTEPVWPHLMGVHAYTTETASSDLVHLDLRVHDGMISGARAPEPRERVIGPVYFRDVELVVPRGWIVVPEVKDPFFGKPYDEGANRVFPIVAPLPDGRMHWMGPQAQFERRLVLAPMGSGGAHELAKQELALDGLAFCQRGPSVWSWWNPDTARYFASRDLLASFDPVRNGEQSGKLALRSRHANELNDLVVALQTGGARGWYVTSGVLGWAHPWFVKEAGGVGGEGIATLEGHDIAYAASAAGYRYLELLHRMNISRQPEAAYDLAGDPVGYHAWLSAEGTIPFDFRTNGGVVMPDFRLPCKWGPPASAGVRDVVARNLRPPYDQGNWFEKDGSVADSPANLLAWWPHDDQHMVRYTKNTKALVWLGNDAMAKDDLLLSAELYHLMRHESPHVKADWSDGVTLAVWEKIVAEHPHQGLWFGREDGWGIDSMCAAYSTQSPEWRAKNRAWFDRMSKLLLDASQPSGLLQRMVNERLLGDTKYTVAQTFECFFLMHALRCMDESVYRGVDDVRREQLEGLLVRGLEYLMWGPPWQRIQNGWQPDPAHPTLYLSGPRQGIAISPNDNYATPPFCDARRWGPNYLPMDGLGMGVEIFHVWQALAYASDATQDTQGRGLENRYLKRALDCWTGHASFTALLSDFATQMSDPSQDNSSNWTGLVGRLQALGVR